MPDKTIDPNKLRQDIIKTLKEAISSYGETVKEIRQRELKKTELCLLCGGEASASCCGVLRKDDSAAMDMANGVGGGGPMAMNEGPKAAVVGDPSLKGKKFVNTGFKLSSLKDKKPLDKDELHEAPGPTVQGARAVPDKKEPGAVLPGDKDPAKDNQPDEGSGGMKKDEYTAEAASKNHGGQCSWCEAKGTHFDTTDTRRNKDLACADHLHHIADHAAPIAPMKKGEAAGLLSTRKAFMKRGKTVADLRAAAAHNPSPMAQPKPTASSTGSIPMGKGEKMDAKTGGRLNAIAGDRMKDIINKPNTKGKSKLGAMGKMAKNAMVPSVQDKVNAVVGDQDPGEVPAIVKETASNLVNGKKKEERKKPAGVEDSKKAEMSAKYGDKVGVSTDKDALSSKSLTKLNAGKGGPVPPVRKDEMAKVSVPEANKELKSFKSLASSPTSMPGGKLTNPNAMSPGKGPKPVAGSITAKNEDRLAEVLGKCGLCGKQEHKKCETV